MNDPASSHPPLPAPPLRRRSAQLFFPVCIALIAVEAYFATHAEVQSPIHLQLGLVMVFLAFVPILRWAKQGKTSLPVFEVFMFTCANTYAFPLLSGHGELIHYSIDEISTAALGVILFQAASILFYEMTPGRKNLGRFWREEVITQNLGQWMTYGLALNTIYLLVSTFTRLVPDSLESVLRAVFFGIGIVCTFITSRRLGNGELSAGERFFFIANVVIQCIAMTSTLYLVGAVSVLLLSLVGYVSSSGRLPIAAAGSALALLAILHNGKSTMRAKYWDNEASAPGIVQLPSFFTEWVEDGLQFNDDSAPRQKMTAKLIDRTSLFHLMCLVVSLTPSHQPYLSGDTYRDIPAQFVPRIFWPEKPLGHISTSKLCIYYGLQTEEDTLKTTIGFGMVTEAYSNFGFFGLIGLAAFIGFFMKKIQGWAEDGPLFSYGGLILVVMLAWSFQVEFTLSIWLASLYQACFAVLFIPFVLRKIFG